MIVEDSGEKITAKHYVGRILEEKNIAFERKEIRINGIQVGDYIGRNGEEIAWIIERKREGDFLNSCLDGRLDSQYERLSSIEDVPKFLIFEGNWNRLLHENPMLMGKLISSRLKAAWFGISFQITESEKETAAFILSLEKYASGFKEIHIKQVRPHLVKSKDERVRHLLVRGMGETKAIELLEKFKSIDDIIYILKTEPSKLRIRGIGEKLLERLNLVFLSRNEVSYNGDIGDTGGSLEKNKRKGKMVSYGGRKKHYL